MGYDMYIRNYEKDDAYEARKKEASEQWDAALAVREKRAKQLREEGRDWEQIHSDSEWKAAHEEVLKASELVDMAQPEYYRLNIGGMGWCRGFMMDRGMAYEDYALEDRFDWPEYTEPECAPGESKEDWYKRIDQYDKEYNERCVPIRSWSPDPEREGIPLHKFGSNDGWLVTEHECRTAAKLGREAPFPTYTDDDGNEKPILWWESWLTFLENASTRGGFEVH
ncbi:hypothetical protein SEA_RIZWANA_82 [Arthrobacter phage Rizwana]|nr:hypothetical protein SEA_RIZWANA_82 [Arthrobacter phage Rizwana]